MQHHYCYVVSVWSENENSANWCTQQSYGIPCITANLILLTLYFLLKLTHFLVKSALRQFIKLISIFMIYSKLKEHTFTGCSDLVYVVNFTCILLIFEFLFVVLLLYAYD